MVILPDQVWSLGTASAEGNRDAMVRFWLAAPADQLEPLWKSHFGTVTVELIRQLTPQTSFSTEQVATRDRINQVLMQAACSSPSGLSFSWPFFCTPPKG